MRVLASFGFLLCFTLARPRVGEACVGVDTRCSSRCSLLAPSKRVLADVLLPAAAGWVSPTSSPMISRSSVAAVASIPCQNSQKRVLAILSLPDPASWASSTSSTLI